MGDQHPAALTQAGRNKVDEYLLGIKAVQDGLFDYYFIEQSDGTWVKVEPSNAVEVERTVREHFAPYYPEIARP